MFLRSAFTKSAAASHVGGTSLYGTLTSSAAASKRFLAFPKTPAMFPLQTKRSFSNSQRVNDDASDYMLPHAVWNTETAKQVSITHDPPKDFIDTLAYNTIQLIRFNFDWMSGWSLFTPSERRAVNRVLFLETIAGIPGCIAGTLRHLSSLRNMKRDYGWIHTLMEEAENERMHLLTFVEIRKPGPFMRSLVFLSQGVFYNFFFLSYLISPRFCHRLVGYLEEEAVKTYTKLVSDYDNGHYPGWSSIKIPEIAIKYWKFDQNATMRELLLAMRADEANHRDVNHALSKLGPTEANPFNKGGH